MLSGKRERDAGKALKPRVQMGLFCPAYLLSLIKRAHWWVLIPPDSSHMNILSLWKNRTQARRPGGGTHQYKHRNSPEHFWTQQVSQWGSELQKKGRYPGRTASLFRGLRLSFWVTGCQGTKHLALSAHPFPPHAHMYG